MYIKVKDFSEIDLEKFGSYRLCYIDHISQEVYNDFTEDWRYHNGGFSRFIPNPEYIDDVSEMWAFFTPVFEDQWGDDWNDAPYEHNAGWPYSDNYEGKGNREDYEYEILQVPFAISDHRWWVKYPDDYGCGNSPFSVEDINHGAVAWIFGSRCTGREKEFFSIHGGETVTEFIKKIEEINGNKGS